MVSIKIKFRPSIVDGKEGSIYFQIIHNRVIRQLKTGYKVYANEWDEEAETLFVSGDRCDILNSVKERLEWDVARLEKVIRMLEMERRKYMTDDVVAAFCKMTKETSMCSFTHSVIAQLKQMGKSRTSETYQTTLNSFMAFRNDVDVPLDGFSSDLMCLYEA